MNKYISFRFFLLVILLMTFISSCEFAGYKIEKVADKEIVKIDIDRDNKGIGRNEKINSTNSNLNDDSNNVEIIDLTDDKDIQKTIDNSITDEKKYCILDICLDSNKEIIEKDDIYLNYFDKAESESYSYITKDKTYIEKITDLGMGSTTEYVSNIGKDYIKQTVGISCGGRNIIQGFYNGNNVLFSDIDTLNIFKKFYKGFNFEDFNIGKLHYKLSINFNIKTNTITNNGYKYIDTKVSKVSDIIDIIEKEIKDDKSIMVNYIFPVAGYKKLYVLYSANIEQPERVIYLGTDKSFLDKNISKNGDFLNLTLTNKIIGYYKEDSAKGFTRGDYKRIFSVTKSDLPVFKLKKLNDKGNYLLYAKEPYSFMDFVEMCKPAVYLYNKTNINNSLEIEVKKGNYITKLIPTFNNGKSWNFSSKNGLIKVLGDTYDYLYYAIKVQNYVHNTDGRIVKGSDIFTFFNDKLTKINFNKKEKSDFINYWLNKFDNDKYYFVSFKYKDDLDKLVKLKFQKKPDSIFRVLLDSYELEDSSNVNTYFLYKKGNTKFDKYLIQRFDRNKFGYEAFEWGGVLQKEDKYIVY